jgi:hypothetical protein
LKTLIPKQNSPFWQVVEFAVGVWKSELNLMLIYYLRSEGFQLQQPCFGNLKPASKWLPDFMQVNTAMQVTTKQQWKRTV